jgi:signal transduction histidine kinase
MGELVWYKSLYWRIAFGFVATLAALLLAQGGVLLWLTDRVVGSSWRTPEQLVASVASDVSAALTENQSLDLDAYVRDHFHQVYRPFLVIMRDGRMTSNRMSGLPMGYIRAAQQRVRRGLPLAGTDWRDGGGRRGDFDRGRPGFDRSPGGRGGNPTDRHDDDDRAAGPGSAAVPAPAGPGGPGGPGGPERGSAVASIVVADAEVGFVVVPLAAPPVFVAIRELGPTLTWVGLALLAIGAASAALLIFGPAHRRLRTLEQAARALGQGRTDVRAVEAGGDEVSSLAHAFNRMADDLSTRADALAASDRARRQLLADVSHELMTPLAAIRGYTETLAMPELTIDADSRERYLGIIGDETMKLEMLIGDLLDLARLEGGGGTMTIEDVPVRELFSRVADRHGPALRDKEIALDVAVTPPDLTVRGDAQKLEQALQNLAANAIRHTPHGGRLQITASIADDVATFAVRDSGPGIPPEHLPHVFERFYKADAARSTSSASGSGLGLSIVRAIVERHGGKVTAVNAPDGGAIFEITLPRPEIRPASD